MPPLTIIKLLPEIAAVILISVVYGIGHMKGTAACAIENVKREAAIAANGERNHAKNEKKVMPLSVTRLDNALRQFLYQ